MNKKNLFIFLFEVVLVCLIIPITAYAANTKSVVTTDKNKHGINIYDSQNVKLENLKVDHTNAIA